MNFILYYIMNIKNDRNDDNDRNEQKLLSYKYLVFVGCIMTGFVTFTSLYKIRYFKISEQKRW